MEERMTKIEKAKPVLQTANLPAGKTGGMVFDPPAKAPAEKHLPMLKTGSRLVYEPDADTHLGGPRTRKTFESEANLAQVTAERKAREAKFGWRKLPSGISIPGDRILSTCNLCHRWDWLEPGHETGDCICYHPQDSDAGVMRPATPAEEKGWFKRAREAHDRFVAGEPARRAATELANRRRREDTPDSGEDHSRGRG
jgi:hypothetical protein